LFCAAEMSAISGNVTRVTHAKPSVQNNVTSQS
jgi:hypothetical protein